MSPKTLHRLALAAILLAACLDDYLPADDSVAACPLTEPVRLAPPPEDWQPGPDNYYYISPTFDGRLEYWFGPDPKETWSIDVCGGEPERKVPEPVPMWRAVGGFETAAGVVTYFSDALREHYALTTPGFDEPRPVQGLPAGELDASPGAGYILFQKFGTPASPDPPVGAAGVGATTFTVYSHDGDPDVPALELGGDVVRYQDHDGDVFLHHEDGTLRRVDPHTGQSELILADVRYAQLHDNTLLWQVMGDDLAEPVYLRNLDTGEDLALGVNDFCQRSWGRGAKAHTWPIAGTWSFEQEDRVLALHGPDKTLARVVRLDTGAAVDVPPHIRASVGGPEIYLVLADSAHEIVLAYWNPLSGELHVWYRGPGESYPILSEYSGDFLEYFLPDAPESGLGSLWRHDFAAGESTRVLARIGYWHWKLDDGRYASLLVPTIAEPHPFDIVVVDPATGIYKTLAERAEAVDLLLSPALYGFAYIDVRGPEPGLWVVPIPPK